MDQYNFYLLEVMEPMVGPYVARGPVGRMGCCPRVTLISMMLMAR